MGAYTYKAFISYRHLPLDIAAAKAIHSRLETFRIPAHIQKKTGQKKLGRCFRDRDELPTSSDLAQDIVEALKNSEWLIVVCTPDTPKSKWCLSEIETFIQLHGRARVLAVLADGEPSESFPDILRFETQPDGTCLEREPLAADLRGGSVTGMKRKLRIERFRLLAPMLGVAFDDLRRRSRERVLKITVTSSIAIAVFFAMFGGYAFSQAAVISRQNTEIAQKNDELMEQIAETSRQKEIAEENEQLAKENEARAIIGENEAKKQAGIAQTNEELAKVNEAKALLNEAEAKTQAGIAQENELRAIAGETEARRQTEIALQNETRAVAGEAEAKRQTELAQLNELRAIAGESEALKQQGIAEANEIQAKTERDNALIGQSKFLASLSGAALDGGDGALASLLALYALPRDLQNPDRPLVAEAERALRNAGLAMHPWYTTMVTPTAFFVASEEIRAYCLYEDVFVAVTNKEICMWNAKSGEAYPPIPLQYEGSRYYYIHKLTPIVRVQHTSGVDIYELQADRESIVKSHTAITLSDHNVFSGKMAASTDEKSFVYYQWRREEDTSMTHLFVSDEVAGTLYKLPRFNGIIECMDVYDSRIAAGIQYYLENNRSKNVGCVLDAKTGETLFELDIYQDPRFPIGWFTPDYISFNADGSLIATITRGVTEIFDGRTGTRVATLNAGLVQEDFDSYYATTAKFSEDGKKIAMLSRGGDLRVYNARTGAEEFYLDHNTIATRSLAWHHGYILATCDGQIVLMVDPSSSSLYAALALSKRLRTEEVSDISSGRFPAIAAVDCADGETTIAVLLIDGEVQIIRTDNTHKTPRVVLEGGGGRDISASGTGQYIASCNTSDLMLFDAQTGEKLRQVHVKDPITSGDTIKIIGWRDNDTKLLVADYGTNRSAILEYNITTDVLTVLYTPPDGFQFNGKTGGDMFVIDNFKEKTFLFGDLLTGEIVREIPYPENMNSFCIQPDGNLIALYNFSGESGEIMISNAATGEPIVNITAAQYPTGDVAISPDGNYIAAILQGYIFAVWDIQDGALIHSADVGATTAMIPLWSSDSRICAVRGTGNMIKVFSVSERRFISSCDIGYMGMFTTYAGLSPDGSMLSVNNAIYDTKSGKQFMTLPFNGVFTNPLKWAGNDRVISGYAGNAAAVWQIVPLQTLIDIARESLEGRELSEAERIKYFLD